MRATRRRCAATPYSSVPSTAPSARVSGSGNTPKARSTRSQKRVMFASCQRTASGDGSAERGVL